MVLDDSVSFVEADGVKISRALFKFFGIDAEKGDIFKFIKRENGIVYVERITAKEEPETQADNTAKFQLLLDKIHAAILRTTGDQIETNILMDAIKDGIAQQKL